MAPRSRLSLVPETTVIPVDRLSFLVPARAFHLEGTILRSGYVSLATEFAMRLLHDAGELAPGELGAFLGFSDVESRTLLEELLLDGYVDVAGEQIRLSLKGERAFDPISGDLRMLEVEGIEEIVTLDLLSFAPAEAPGNIRHSWLPEIEVTDRERAASARDEATRGFGVNFGEWRDRRYRGADAALVRLQSFDVVPLARTTVPMTVSLTYSPALSDGVEPDFSDLRDRGRRDARRELIEALAGRIRLVVAPGDGANGAAFASSWDGGVLVGPRAGAPVNPLVWSQIASRTPPAPLPDELSPAVRLCGSSASSSLLSTLSTFLDGVAGPETEEVPIIWIPAEHAAWGASVDLLDVTRQIRSGLARSAGLMLMPRSGTDPRARRELDRAYGPGRDGRRNPLFDACVALPPTAVPLSLELIVQPGIWAVALLHLPAGNGFPIPVGYATRNANVLRAISSVLGGIVAGLEEAAVIWNVKDSSPLAVLKGLERVLTV